ncbi:MAG: site-2 protease family protein [Chloroflexi bacterium]|nr:site-2 protease family protein [Chloroflexota bacterium]MDA1003076.1 site-2 protease family protein [Chloroflexota bacterium]MQC27822.1 site-2 protease family protein [Chloroflexota bacterium]
MIFRFLSVLTEAPNVFLVLFSAFLVAMLTGLAFHEFSHALVADKLGDHTARRMGRLSLNPLRHLDPVGSLLIFFVGFGWAKPVPVNPFNTSNPKRSMTLISFAGPVSNLVMAGLAAIPIKLGLVPFLHPFVDPRFVPALTSQWSHSPADLAGLFLGTIVLLNVLLAIFNLIPIAPLDGFRAAVGLLPDGLSQSLARLEPWGPGILMLLIFAPFLTGGQINPLFDLMDPLIGFLLNLFVGNGGAIRIA